MKRFTSLLVAVGALVLAGIATAASAPTASTGAATSIGATSATLNGTVNPNGTDTTVYFQYGTSTNYGSQTAHQGAGSGTSPEGVTASIGGLQTGRTYHFRLVATSTGGTSFGADATFTPAARAGAPTVTTGGTSSVGSTSATLHGQVNPNSQSTSYSFEFGTSTAYGTKTAAKNAGSGTSSTSVTASLAGLAPGTTYHYRLVASNNIGTTLGDDRTFATNGPPVVQTGPANSVTVNSATLTGTVSPQGHSTKYHFDYGTTTAYGSKTSNKSAGSGSSPMAVSFGVGTLVGSTTYHFRLVASSSLGTSVGADQAFTTLAAVTIAQSGFRVIAGHYTKLSGTLASGATGASIAILGEPFGASSFTQIATVLTGAGGVWTYLAKPTIRTMYEASANGGTSTAVTIGVQPAVSLRLITGRRYLTRVSAGSTMFSGRLVQFQRKSGDRWITVKRTRLSSASSAIFSTKVLPRGHSTVRIAISVNQAGPGYLGGFSRALSFTRR